MDYCELSDFDYYITCINYSMMNCKLSFTLLSTETGENKCVEISEIEEIVWKSSPLNQFHEDN